ncbi:MAG TPA: hypothetical protein ENI19_00745 [Candidatus Nealsonbacteria bacterium]|uniref:Uncharacterized protein n=1 Tax=marine sediment metagenome TaxID=412755 RepID=A0A0F9WZ43_9ZZZZ|nr:hypothetical protein [Candidatus Nealsonbacteria bacterium]HEB46220.1 hypothetical protein [Candidatus Nealsonbacteria bacterium]
MNILARIQNQPKHIRKIIFWVTIVIIGIILLLTWIQGVKTRIKEVEPRKMFEQLKPSTFGEDLENIPKIELPEFPEISEEEFKKLEEELIKESKEQIIE